MSRSLTTLILHDLAIGQATAASIADRMRKPAAQIAAILVNLAREELVEPRPIGNCLTAYRLTLSGREAITAKKTQTTPQP
jgi:predicted ArsR family transcriptional regulator